MFRRDTIICIYTRLYLSIYLYVYTHTIRNGTDEREPRHCQDDGEFLSEHRQGLLLDLSLTGWKFRREEWKHAHVVINFRETMLKGLKFMSSIR